MLTPCVQPPTTLPAGLDFEEHFLRIRPQLLVVTEDDKYGQAKRELCAQVRQLLTESLHQFNNVQRTWKQWT